MNGVLNINKPAGITSFDVVAIIRKELWIKKIGHAGTLDPMATGVLVMCLGEATKLVSYLMDGEKEYRGCLKLGEETTTEDRTGDVTQKNDFSSVREKDVYEVFQSFVREVEQVPPVISALKYKGKPLYKYAREGNPITPEARKIWVHELHIEKINLPFVHFLIRCGKGTYVRSLCRDIGRALKVGGHLFELQRTRSGSFRIEESIALDEVEKGKDMPIMSMVDALKDIPSFTVHNLSLSKIKNGGQPHWDDFIRDSLFWGQPQKEAVPKRDCLIIKNGDVVRLLTKSHELLALAEMCCDYSELSTYS